MHYVALRYLLKLRQDATPWQTATCLLLAHLKQGNPLYSNHQDLLYDRFLPPTRCARGSHPFFSFIPGLAPWATNLTSLDGTLNHAARRAAKSHHYRRYGGNFTIPAGDNFTRATGEDFTVCQDNFSCGLTRTFLGVPQLIGLQNPITTAVSAVISLSPQGIISLEPRARISLPVRTISRVGLPANSFYRRFGGEKTAQENSCAGK